MIRCLTHKKNAKRGFTMMEVLVVVGIIAVIAAIAIPSVISMRKNMDYKQRCDYAKTIFLAAQSNLADLRSTGELKNVADEDAASKAVLQANDTGMPDRFTDRYIFTSTGDDRYDAVLPVNSIESVIRDQNVIIEYNPRTGIVHAVFYAEGNYDLLGNYNNRQLERNEQWLKDNLVGYYGKEGDTDVSEELGFKTVYPEISFENGQEAILTVDIPTRTDKSDEEPFFNPNEYAYYVKGLEINLTVAGENSGVFLKNLKKSGEEMQIGEPHADSTGAMVIPLHFILDSLAEGKGFYDIPENKNGEGYYVLPGDNVSLFVEVSYVPTSQNDPLIMYDDAVLAGVNPLFHALTGEASNYTVAISNGRHLQNLNGLHSDIASSVKTITFLGETKSETTEDGKTVETTSAPIVDWAETVSYYQVNHAVENLKYFVPIDNDGLFNRSTQNILLIKGDNAVISNLKISDATREEYVGLFRTLNGVTLENLRIVDPVIRGGGSEKDQKGVGTLAGAVQNSTIKNCYIYVNVVQEGFNSAHLNLGTDFGGTGTTDQQYGVVGCTAVGGMVGYSVNSTYMASFAAVPVYGDMDGANGSNVGVGGFVGAADGGSFNKCYTSVRTVGLGANADSGTFDSACGLGGFVGTGNNTEFSNCFASGNVTHKSGNLAGCGGFVGITNGSGKFSACYALGTVHVGGTMKAKFVGKIFSDKQDYYKALLNNSNEYVFRDCYYLQGKAGVLNADNYTLPASFDMLYSLHTPTQNAEYIFSALQSQGITVTASQAEDLKIKFQASEFKTSGCWMQGYQSMKDGNGYYSYNNGINGNYPYSMLTEMPFYGIWPDAPSEVGIAYVEIYADGTPGFYYDNMDKMTLQDKTVIADGYAILTANGGRTADVTINGTTTQIPLIFSETVNNREFYYGFIPVNKITASSDFYTEVKLYDSQLLASKQLYTMYFNPYVAGSQKNPSGSSVTATYPDMPETIYIHSARQLNALATKMSAFWGKDYTLVGTIDFDSYGINDEMLTKYGFSEETAASYGVNKQTFTSIGTGSSFFGKLNGISNATVNVTGANTGLIGTLEAGTVSNITITGSMTLGNNEGALVNEMKLGSTLKDCTVAAVVTPEEGSTSAGLVVGALNGGTITNCHSTGTNSALGFAGTAAENTSQNVEGATHFGNQQLEDGSYTQDQLVGLTKIAAETPAVTHSYQATIDDESTLKLNEQIVKAADSNHYYYSVTEKKGYTAEETPAISFTQKNIALKEFGTETKDWTLYKSYYCEVSGKYYPVYVKVDVNTETVTIPTDSTGTEGEQNPPDGSVESATETVTTYTYSFGYSGTAGEYTVYGDPKVTNNPENETVALYTISLPASGKYILRNAEGKILKNDLNVADGEITADMVWDAGENAWVSGDKSISVSLNIPEAGAEQYPYVTVNGTDYKAYAVTVSTNYELKRLAQDAVYSTTDPTDDA